MEVQLTPDQDAFIRQAIETGRLHRKEDAVQEAMSLWDERERRRLEILVAVDQAEASLARGEGRTLRRNSLISGDSARRRGAPGSPSRWDSQHSALMDNALEHSDQGTLLRKAPGSRPALI